MEDINGNVLCYLKTKSKDKNEIGENIPRILTEFKELFGWLDFIDETTGRTNFNSKMRESTHVFLCNYQKIDKSIRDLIFIDHEGNEYDITYIDNPMNLNYHLEIFLKYVGD